MKKMVAVVVASLSLGGCASLTGLDAKGDFACAAPEGFSCTSMTGVYANISNPDLPKGKKATFLGASSLEYAPRHKPGMDQYGRTPLTQYQDTGIPIRTQPQIMRIWVVPWESTDKTFYDQNYVYSVVDYGDWVLTHNKSNILSEFSPIGVKKGDTTSVDVEKQYNNPPTPVPAPTEEPFVVDIEGNQ